MATVKKGMLTATGEWWRHLRGKKRAFWKTERQAAKDLVRSEQTVDACREKDCEKQA